MEMLVSVLQLLCSPGCKVMCLKGSNYREKNHLITIKIHSVCFNQDDGFYGLQGPRYLVIPGRKREGHTACMGEKEQKLNFPHL